MNEVTDKPKLELALAIEVDEQVVSGREDYVYPALSAEEAARRGTGSCSYERDGAPSCVVGHIFAELGISAEELHLIDIDKHPDTPDLLVTTADNVAPVLFDIDEQTVDFLSTIQRYQDGRQPWGLALQAAKNSLNKEKTK